jgi:hypothetical protein
MGPSLAYAIFLNVLEGISAEHLPLSRRATEIRARSYNLHRSLFSSCGLPITSSEHSENYQPVCHWGTGPWGYEEEAFSSTKAKPHKTLVYRFISACCSSWRWVERASSTNRLLES